MQTPCITSIHNQSEKKCSKISKNKCGATKMAAPKDKCSFDLAEVQFHFFNHNLENTERMQLTRRNSEFFKILFVPWKQHRHDTVLSLSSLIETVNNLQTEHSCKIFKEKSKELKSCLAEDIQMVWDQISIFDQYLDNAVKIKTSADKVIFGDLPEQIIHILRAKHPSYFCTLKLSEENKCVTVQDIEILLDLVAELADTLGGIPIVFKTAAENFKFLSLHWGILNQLSLIREGKGPILDVRLIPDRFLNPELTEEPPSYYDLTSNISVCSYAIAVLGTFLSMHEDEILSQKVEVAKKLQILEAALTNRMYQLDAITELLITET